MLCRKTEIGNGPGRTGHGMSAKGVKNLLAVASVLALAPVVALAQAEPKVRPPVPAPGVRVQVQPQAQTQPQTQTPRQQLQSQSQRQADGQAQAAAIPACLAKLDLTPQQQSQVQQIVGRYEESKATVWQQFSSRYMQAIEMESMLLAAIEDHLTESQRQQVRDQRRKTAQMERAMAATSTKANQAAVSDKEETTKPATAAEEGLAAVEVSLTDEQEEAADRIQEKYRAQLRSLNRDIQGLHIRLVSLEADKLVEMEKILTKEQLAQLREHRQNAPVAPKLAVTQTESR
jgi:hypothetical protein